jgi:hypothetical protein
MPPEQINTCRDPDLRPVPVWFFTEYSLRAMRLGTRQNTDAGIVDSHLPITVHVVDIRGPHGFRASQAHDQIDVVNVHLSIAIDVATEAGLGVISSQRPLSSRKIQDAGKIRQVGIELAKRVGSRDENTVCRTPCRLVNRARGCALLCNGRCSRRFARIKGKGRNG